MIQKRFVSGIYTLDIKCNFPIFKDEQVFSFSLQKPNLPYAREPDLVAIIGYKACTLPGKENHI